MIIDEKDKALIGFHKVSNLRYVDNATLISSRVQGTCFMEEVIAISMYSVFSQT